jgi:hypothetical protein
MWIQDDRPIIKAIPFISSAIAIYRLRLLLNGTMEDAYSKAHEIQGTNELFIHDSILISNAK